MICLNCGRLMTSAQIVERLNCQRIEYTCTRCTFTDFDFIGIRSFVGSGSIWWLASTKTIKSNRRKLTKAQRQANRRALFRRMFAERGLI